MTTAEKTGARIDWDAFKEAVPEVATGMAAINHAYKKSGMERDLFELIKVRASQINGCAFCGQYHLNDARKLNIAPRSSTCSSPGANQASSRSGNLPPSNGRNISPCWLSAI